MKKCLSIQPKIFFLILLGSSLLGKPFIIAENAEKEVPDTLSLEDALNAPHAAEHMRSKVTIGTSTIHAALLGLLAWTSFMLVATTDRGWLGDQGDLLRPLFSYFGVCSLSGVGGSLAGLLHKKVLSKWRHKMLAIQVRNIISLLIPSILLLLAGLYSKGELKWNKVVSMTDEAIRAKLAVHQTAVSSLDISYNRRIVNTEIKQVTLDNNNSFMHFKNPGQAVVYAFIALVVFLFITEAIRYYRDYKSEKISCSITLKSSSLYGALAGAVYGSLALIAHQIFNANPNERKYEHKPINDFSLSLKDILAGMMLATFIGAAAGLICGGAYKRALKKKKKPLRCRNLLFAGITSTTILFVAFIGMLNSSRMLVVVFVEPVIASLGTIFYMVFVECLRLYAQRLFPSSSQHLNEKEHSETSP